MDNGSAKPAGKKIPPPPPSIGSSSGGDTPSRVKGPPAPSIAASKRTAIGAAESTLSKRQRKELEHNVNGIPKLAPDQQRVLKSDQAKLKWLYGRGPCITLRYDDLVLKRKLAQSEPELFVDTTFCRSDVLQDIMEVKYTYKAQQEKFFRTRNNMCNFEKLFGKDTFYQHSDFIKAANIDALMDFQLTQPRSSMDENLVGPNEVLFFADIYGGPGGFTEYMLWKKQWHARGFGFTSTSNDWKLEQKPHYPRECFETIYGFHDLKGKGDIHDTDEVKWFIKHVRRVTGRKGVHVVFANGGDDTETGDEDKKELRCKYMFLAEVAIALTILREGGHFVFKIYDMFTTFTNGLILLLHQLFDAVTVHKPETVLLASSERYVLCKGKKWKGASDVVNFLTECWSQFNVSQRLRRNESQTQADIKELIPASQIQYVGRYMDAAMEWNATYGNRQLEQTRSILNDIQSGRFPQLIRAHHALIQKKAVNQWGIPSEFKLPLKLMDSDGSGPEIKATMLVAPYPPETFIRIERDGEQELNFTTMEDDIVNPAEWHLFLVGRDRGFFLSLGGRDVFRFSGGCWVKLNDPVELAANTIVYGDIVDEIVVHENKQILTTGLQIMDALMLGGKDIRSLPHNERLELCKKFATAMDKPNRGSLAAVRAKAVYGLSQVEAVIRRIISQRLKGGRGPAKEITYPVEGDDGIRVFKPTGVLLTKTTKTNLIPADFLHAMQNRLMWHWYENVSLEAENPEALKDAAEKNGPIHAATLIQHVNSRVGISAK